MSLNQDLVLLFCYYVFMTIRKMTTLDLPAVLAIEEQVHHSPWSQETLREYQSRGAAFVLVHEDKIIGYAFFSVVQDEAELLNISIADSCQHRGYGSELLKTLIKQLQEEGVEHIYLEVRRSNKSAIHLYEKHGFKQLSVRKDYYPAETGREDALVYSLIVKS